LSIDSQRYISESIDSISIEIDLGQEVKEVFFKGKKKDSTPKYLTKDSRPENLDTIYDRSKLVLGKLFGYFLKPAIAAAEKKDLSVIHNYDIVRFKI
jgi:hypothetical protein